MARVVVLSGAAGPGKGERTRAWYPIGPGGQVEIGRQSDIAIGVDPEDPGVSRRSLRVTRQSDSWTLDCTNANGAVIHPWGQAPRWADNGRPTEFRWPYVAVRVVGSSQDLHHWVLLEAPEQELRTERPDSTNTAVSQAPAPLTGAQLQAVQRVFAQYLAWPPVAGASATPLQSAAGRLGVTQAAVYQRLEAVRARSYQLGSHTQIGVSDPEYVFVLVRAGLIPLPEELRAQPGPAAPEAPVVSSQHDDAEPS
jgi:hypothetical protein